jgi:hypothetical protein
MATGADAFGPKAWSAHGPLRCHATETGSARGWKQANADADFIAAAPADIAALVAEVELLQQEARVQRAISDGLVAEVEHLRATVVALRASVPPTHPAEYGHEVWFAALVEAKKEGARSAVAEREAERAAVVAWLRERAEAIRKGEYEPANREGALELTAISIERGEHRRKEKE